MMGLLHQAYRTYCAMEQEYLGRYQVGQKEPLAPICHVVTAAQIEITLDEAGRFVSARPVDKLEPKIIIPVTEDSGGRTSSPCAHPLCDKLEYLAGFDGERHRLYVDQLRGWAESDCSHPTLHAVLRYIEGRTILADLQRYDLVQLNDKGIPKKRERLVCWRVLDPEGIRVSECWKDPTLVEAFIRYEQKKWGGDRSLCMVSGVETVTAKQHPRGIIPGKEQAKLISSNDHHGFTYRGRFSMGWQAATVGYVTSMKAHSALRWVAVNQGVKMGERTFLCWNPEGVPLPSPNHPLFRGQETQRFKPSDYRAELEKTLKGWKSELPEESKAVIAAFDAATKGRLSLTYYNELQASDFLQRLHDWDAACCWWNGCYGVQSPSVYEIVNCAFGVQRIERKKAKIVADHQVLRQQVQRLIACRIDGTRIPADIVRTLVNRASNPVAYEESCWRKMVFVACAVIQCHHAFGWKEDLCMSWELDKRDRSFQYGRLLAVLDRAELDYYYFTGMERRTTNAVKSMFQLKQTPWAVFERVNLQLEQAYLPRLHPKARDRYDRLKSEIVSILLEFPEEELKKPLNENYLIGYERQRAAFFETNRIDEENRGGKNYGHLTK